MSDLSDPTALPDDVREAAKHALDVFNARRDDEIIDALAPVLAAHFAAEAVRESHGRELHHFETEVENEGLRAQIEEAQALRNKPGAHKEHVLAAFAQSPRGTVARIQAEALEAFADKIGKTVFARDEVVGLLCDEADALREGAGQ